MTEKFNEHRKGNSRRLARYRVLFRAAEPLDDLDARISPGHIRLIISQTAFQNADARSLLNCASHSRPCLTSLTFRVYPFLQGLGMVEILGRLTFSPLICNAL